MREGGTAQEGDLGGTVSRRDVALLTELLLECGGIGDIAAEAFPPSILADVSGVGVLARDGIEGLVFRRDAEDCAEGGSTSRGGAVAVGGWGTGVRG